MTLISLALAYPLLVISVAAFMINATVMCIISIVILGVLALLFVLMFLFEYTRGYFESWVKLLISFLLQPMVITTFILLQGSSTNRKVKIFYIDNDWKNYPKEEAKSCKNSLGYMLNNLLNAVLDLTKDIVIKGKNLDKVVEEKPGSLSTSEYLSRFDFLKDINSPLGIFFAVSKLIFEKIKNLVLALITACFTLHLMYHFSAQLADFAADMTEGVAWLLILN